MKYKLRLIKSAITNKVVRHTWRDDQVRAVTIGDRLPTESRFVRLIKLVSIKVDTNSLIVHLK